MVGGGASKSDGRHSLSSQQWTPLESLRNASPSALATFDGRNPRLAKDEDYATAVLNAWQQEIKSSNASGPETDARQELLSDSHNSRSGLHSDSHDSRQTVGSMFAYRRDDGLQLNGYIVALSKIVNSSKPKGKVPGIMLFHTGAGPQDVFLRWKADILVRNDMFGEDGCIVMIADILSDAEGWAWNSKRTKFNEVSEDLLSSFEQDGWVGRWKLRKTVRAALDALTVIQEVDVDKIAALGWCLGGYPILELGLMKERGVKALVTYHGVFDGVGEKTRPTGESTDGEKTQVLICNGQADPFVDQLHIHQSKIILESGGCEVTILNFDGVKHGFTNPAQDCNPSEAFAFNKEAAQISWESTIKLLCSVFT